MNYLLKGGKLVDPYRNLVEEGDLYIVEGKIRRLYKGPVDQVVDCRGQILTPGFIDAHCHLRDPGFTYKEDIISGTQAAAKGGYVAVGAMPNTRPVCDNVEVVRYQIKKAEQEGFCRVIPYATASLNEAGTEISPLAELFAAGACHVTDDGMPVKDSALLRQVMLEADRYGMVLSDHCEDKSLTRGGLVNEGEVSRELGLAGIPSVAEDINAARDILMAEYLDLPIHISHISSGRTVDLVRAAKARGVRVTSEVCPHHFSLNEQSLRKLDANYRMYPPIRTEADRKACIEGLRDGTIDFIATDHAPHAAEEKADFAKAMHGIVGLETAFPLAYKVLVDEENFELMEVLAMFSSKPAQFFKLAGGGLSEGSPADLVLIDCRNEYVFKAEEMLSKSRNTPFDGWKFKARIIKTWWNGRITYAGN